MPLILFVMLPCRRARAAKAPVAASDEIYFVIAGDLANLILLAKTADLAKCISSDQPTWRAKASHICLCDEGLSGTAAAEAADPGRIATFYHPGTETPASEDKTYNLFVYMLAPLTGYNTTLH